jgi:hypothetical protein
MWGEWDFDVNMRAISGFEWNFKGLEFNSPRTKNGLFTTRNGTLNNQNTKMRSHGDMNHLGLSEHGF